MGEDHVERAEFESHRQRRVEPSAQNRLGGRAFVSGRARHRLEQNECQRVYVALGCSRFTNGLLRREVPGGVESHPFAIRAREPGKSHVTHAHLTFGVEEELRRSEVAEDETLSVDVGERARHVATESSSVVNAESTSGRKNVIERAATQVLADHEDGARLLAAVKNPCQVGVAQRGGTNDPVAKGAANVLVRSEVRQENLDDYASLE